MKKRAQDILRKEKIFVGLEDSKKTWQLCVRSGGMTGLFSDRHHDEIGTIINDN